MWSQTGEFFTTLETFMVPRSLVIEIVTTLFLREYKSMWVAPADNLEGCSAQLGKCENSQSPERLVRGGIG